MEYIDFEEDSDISEATHSTATSESDKPDDTYRYTLVIVYLKVVCIM